MLTSADLPDNIPPLGLVEAFTDMGYSSSLGTMQPHLLPVLDVEQMRGENLDAYLALVSVCVLVVSVDRLIRSRRGTIPLWWQESRHG